MTVYFPLVVHGAMLIEPTEIGIEGLARPLHRDACATSRWRRSAATRERFTGAPYHAPRRRLDETRAARQPVLKWTPPQPVAEAAE